MDRGRQALSTRVSARVFVGMSPLLKERRAHVPTKKTLRERPGQEKTSRFPDGQHRETNNKKGCRETGGFTGCVPYFGDPALAGKLLTLTALGAQAVDRISFVRRYVCGELLPAPTLSPTRAFPVRRFSLWTRGLLVPFLPILASFASCPWMLGKSG